MDILILEGMGMWKQLLALSISAYVIADEVKTVSDSPWFGFAETGYAWSIKTGTKNPDSSFWDDAAQGYNTRLNGASFITVGFGRSFYNEMIDASVLYGQLGVLHYQKYQTGSSTTPGFTGNARTRLFNVEHQHALIRMGLDAKKYLSCTIWNVAFSPVGSIGIGVGVNNTSNFNTVAYNSTMMVGSTTSVGKPVTKTTFAWEGSLGIRVQPEQSHVGMKLGYNYLDGGKFRCPSVVMLNTSDVQGGQRSGAPWKGSVRTHQILFSLDIKG